MGNEVKIIDLDNLNASQIRDLDRIASDSRVNFNAIIGHVHEMNKDNLGWLFSTLASRSNYVCPLFVQCCKLEAVIGWIKEFNGQPIEIACKDFLLGREIKKYLKVNHISNVEVLVESSCKKIAKAFKNFIYLFITFYIKLFLQWRASSKKKCPAFTGAPLILLDVFLFSGEQGSGCIKNGLYSDRYYPGLYEKLNESHEHEVFYTANLNSYRDIGQDFKNMREAETRFLIKQDYFEFKDFLCLASSPFKALKVKIPDVTFKERNVTFLAKLAHYQKIFDYSGCEALVNYLFCKRLREKGCEVKLIINWNENQNIDRGFALGVRMFLPQTRIIGYQGYIISPVYNFHTAPTQYEIDSSLIPDAIAVPGEALLDSPKIFTKDFEVFVAPAFRFQQSGKNKIQKKNNKKIRVLISLPIEREEAEQIVNMVEEARQLLSNSDIEFWGKRHPASNSKIYSDKLKNIAVDNKAFQWKKGPMVDLFDKCEIFIGSASSSCIEAIAKGLFTIILANPRGITQNPIPNFVNKSLWDVCYTAPDLAQKIRLILNQKNNYRKLHSDLVRAQCFEPVSDERIQAFLNNCTSIKPKAVHKIF